MASSAKVAPTDEEEAVADASSPSKNGGIEPSRARVLPPIEDKPAAPPLPTKPATEGKKFEKRKYPEQKVADNPPTDAAKVYNITLQPPLSAVKNGTPTNTLECSLDPSGQHTIAWTSSLTFDDGDGEPVTILDGSCNLYLYPLVYTSDGEKFKATGRILLLVKNLILQMATAPGSDFMYLYDQVGAYVQHALIVGNTPESLDVGWDLFVAIPKLLNQVHGKHRAGFPLFYGESNLHICAVNKQQDLFLKLLDLGEKHLTADEFGILLKSQARGVFFDEMPMRFYGGTPLAYAACFDQREAVTKMVRTGVVDLNDRDDSCVITGFMPLHAVAANGLKSTYEWMVKGLDEDIAADETQVTSVGRMVSLQVHSLSTLQLTAQLGDHATFKHVLRKQAAILWIWGPVTQYSIALAGVDSAGDGGGDVMELIGRVGASVGTTEMLLPEFMQGFINDLFVQKWERFGYKIHYVRRLLDAILLCSLIYMAMALKADPAAYMASPGASVAPVIQLIIMVVTLEEEARSARLFWNNNKGEGDARLPTTTMLKNTITWCRSMMVDITTLAFIFVGISAVLVLSGALSYPDYDPVAALADGSRRELKGADVGMNSDANIVPSNTPVTSVDNPIEGLMWLTLSFGIVLLTTCFAKLLFAPFESLNVFVLSVGKMLQEDLMIFLILFAFFIAAFYFLMFVLYPRAGTYTLPQAPDFNAWYTGLRALIELALTGSAMRLVLDPTDFGQLDTWQTIDMALFIIMYVLYIILSLILLLNLLIAMLSNTFERVNAQATLQCRLSFAQIILKLELLAESFGMLTNVGEMSGGKYVFNFKSVEKNSEGGSAGGSEDPFENPDGGPLARIEEKLDTMVKTELASKDDPPPATLEGVMGELKKIREMSARLEALEAKR